MARPLRLELADGVYHVTARGNERRSIFRDDADRSAFMGTLAQVVGRFSWGLLAYCLMDNHYHLLVRTPQPNLARGMRQLNGVYAQRFNRRHERVGHLFQGRYAAILVEAGEHLLIAARYIVRNPVRAGLCGDPTEWRWSSHRAVLGLQPAGVVAADEVLSCFALSPAEARELYRAFTVDGEGEPVAPEGVVFGSDPFRADRLSRVFRRPCPEVPRRHRQPPRPSLVELLAHHDRDEAIALAYRRHAYTLDEIAGALGRHYATVSRRLRAYEQRMSQCKT